MTTSRNSQALGLRGKAVKALRGKRRKRFAGSAFDAEALVHELQVHQVELEMQNEELRSSRLKLEQAKLKYADLFDFAPVGYFTLDASGCIIEANVRGASLLGVERGALLHRPFASFLARSSDAIFVRYLRGVFTSRSLQLCELTLLTADGTPLSVRLESLRSSAEAGHARCCRMAVIDLTLRRHVEEALRKAQSELELRVQQRTRELSESNRALQAEIRQRQKAEKALQEAHQDLELRVQRRTAELWRTNQALAAEVVQRKQAEEAHQRVLQRLVEAQEAERCRVARELHDQFGQEVAALSLGLKAISEQLPAPSPLRPHLARMLEIVDTVLRDVHALVWKLRPPILDDLGLHAALERYTAEWARLSGIPVQFHNRGLEQRRLPSQIETTLYRIAQEALTNIARHAQARRVSVVLECQPAQVGLIIEDDGRGFPVKTVLSRGPDAQGHVGLLGMQERATLAGGTVNIESSRGSGTTVFVRLPAAAEPAREVEAYEKNSCSLSRRSQHHA